MIIVLTGATGSGKSCLAIELAKKIDGEIINGDAFQVYKGIEIATAAPTENEKQEVPHHLYSFLECDDGYDIFRYQHDLRNMLDNVISRGRIPIIVGGSGLYLRSALYDYDLTVNSNKVDMQPYENLSNRELHEALEKLDPVEANKVHENNRIRIMRSIEVCLANGTSKTEMINSQKHQPIYDDCFFFELKRDRDDLYPLVETRVDKMVKAGLVEQVTEMVNKYGQNSPAFKAIGIKELFPYLNGESSLEDCIVAIKTNTRHYIKRQETFFRHQFNLIEISSIDDIFKAIN